MPDLSLIILYVDSPSASAAFYAELLEVEPIEASSTFVMFPLKLGVMLGLWSRHTVEPSAKTSGGGTELAFTVVDAEAVNRTYEAWKEKTFGIAQAPVDLDFGRTFVALDPDGHRLRVLAAPTE